MNGEQMISEITLLPDGRVHLHGVSRALLELMMAAGIEDEKLGGLLRLDGGGEHGRDKAEGNRISVAGDERAGGGAQAEDDGAGR